MPRKTKLTKELSNDIINVLKSGNFVNVACDYVGIHHTQFYRWCELGLDHTKTVNGVSVVVRGREPYRTFRTAVVKAQAQAEVMHLGLLQAAAVGPIDSNGKPLGQGDWKASEAFLRRRHPERWGREFKNLEVKGDVNLGGSVGVNAGLAVLADEKATELVNDLLERLGPSEAGRTSGPSDIP